MLTVENIMNRLRVNVLLLILAIPLAIVACDGDASSQQQATGDQLQQGIVFFKNGDYENAIPLLEPYALSGDSSACRFVGLAYALGLGVSIDAERAKEIFGYAPDEAASNHFMVGKELEEREAPQEGSIAAFDWYVVAAELGSKSAALRIADAYSNGELGLTTDSEKAQHWIQRSEILEQR